MSSIDLRAREMEMTAELVRQWLYAHPELELLRDAGIRLQFGYDRTAVWLRIGDRVASRIDWSRWWKAGLDTREHRAGLIAHRLVEVWGEGAGDVPLPEQ